MNDYGDEIIVKKVISDNDKAPLMRAEITIDGTKYKAGLWIWTRKDGSQVRDKAGNLQYKGRIELDDYEAPSAPPQPVAVTSDFRDDDIPFN